MWRMSGWREWAAKSGGIKGDPTLRAGIFVRLAGGLYDAINGDMFEHDDFSYD